MRSSPIWLILAGFMILLDLYVFQIIRVVSHGSPKARSIIFTSYWIISIAAIIILFVLPLLKLDNYSKGVRSTVFAVIIGLFLAKLVAAVFFLVDDIRRVIQWLVGKVFFRNTEGEQMEEERISRSLFLSWFGLAVGGGLFSSLIYGFSNKYRYQVKKLRLAYPNLPASFKGLKVVQVSDIHSGSFTDKAAVQKGVDKVLALKPDLILFTGDLVNNRSDEMDGYMDVFSRLKAPMGVFSTLGNHDYGDYTQWPSKEAKRQNLERLKQIHAELGWRLLMNEHVLIERGGEQIAVIGVENWSSKARFPKYGDMSKAYPGTETVGFKILMSHDPSHWDGEIRPKYPDIDLMLAGHTHGMQFGVEIPWLKWSPVQYVYKQWAGLYESGRQKLYVNRGYGFIGYPGRVGILPEITLFEFS
ncbi:MAG: metallophosphoesterase [Flavisolibacter sp.]